MGKRKSQDVPPPPCDPPCDPFPPQSRKAGAVRGKAAHAPPAPPASTASSYWDMLRHPAWQEMRLRVMDRAGFRCEECGDKDTTLNVHHSYYTKGAKPWEYPAESLKCLCEKCHERRHAILAGLKAMSGELSTPLLDLLQFVCAGILAQQRNAETGEDQPFTVERSSAVAVWQLLGLCAAYLDPGSLYERLVEETWETGGRITHDRIQELLNETVPQTLNAA